jgi:hypothetical protein
MFGYPRRIRWAGHVAHLGEVRNACRILVGEPERQSTRKTLLRYGDVEMDFKETGFWECRLDSSGSG